MNKKKVLYIIFSSSDTAGGGHFYSLKTISKALQESIDYRILNLGYVFASPLLDVEYAHYIDLTNKNFISRIRKVINFINKYNPDVIHAFDSMSLFIARTYCLFNNKLVVYTQCGGANWRTKYLPDSDVQILFSKENLDHHLLYGNPNTPKYLIPNRSNKIETDTIRLSKLIEEFDLKDKFILLRISRFNSYYDLTFRQSLNLLRKYLLHNKNSVLIFIGKIQEKDYFEEIKTISKGLPVIFITNEYYTKDANLLIEIASVLVCTGRGVMEACSLNKTVFCPVHDNEVPIVLNKQTFDILFRNNFSERTKLDSNYIEQQNINTIENNLNNETFLFFENFFSVEKVKTKYIEIYELEHKTKFKLINYLLHMIIFFK